MIGMTVGQVADLVGAPRPGVDLDCMITGVEFDTRKITPGALFVALRGERVDGSDFAAAAAAAGAVAVLGAREIDPAAGIPLIRVADEPAVLAALSVLAHANVTALVERTGLCVVGVTGSSGKTSTKDLIAAVLRAAGPDSPGPDSPGPDSPGLDSPGLDSPGLDSHGLDSHGLDSHGSDSHGSDSSDAVIAPPESFNNELGHPYTALRAGPGTRFLVMELSARGPGHIAALAATAPPRIGAVLNVGSAHLGEFGSVAAITAAKGELVEALPSAADGGVAVLNADDPNVLSMATRTSAAVVLVGTGPNATVRATEMVTDGSARFSFSLLTPEGSAPVRLLVAGAHQVSNALAAAAVGRAVGMDVAVVAAALSAAGPASKWRMEITERSDGVTVVNDSYNANPESMRAALQSLATIGENRRTWAVLGEMAELGPAARQAHDDIGRLAVRLGVDRLLVVGAAARALHLGAHLEGSWGGESEIVDDVAAALRVLTAELRPGDVVLIKASRSAGLERVAAGLLALPDVPHIGGIPAGSAVPDDRPERS